MVEPPLDLAVLGFGGFRQGGRRLPEFVPDGRRYPEAVLLLLDIVRAGGAAALAVAHFQHQLDGRERLLELPSPSRFKH